MPGPFFLGSVTRRTVIGNESPTAGDRRREYASRTRWEEPGQRDAVGHAEVRRAGRHRRRCGRPRTDDGGRAVHGGHDASPAISADGVAGAYTAAADVSVDRCRLSVAPRRRGRVGSADRRCSRRRAAQRRVRDARWSSRAGMLSEIGREQDPIGAVLSTAGQSCRRSMHGTALAAAQVGKRRTSTAHRHRVVPISANSASYSAMPATAVGRGSACERTVATASADQAIELRAGRSIDDTRPTRGSLWSG
jgi:hypothetical protein